MGREHASANGIVLKFMDRDEPLNCVDQNGFRTKFEYSLTTALRVQAAVLFDEFHRVDSRKQREELRDSLAVLVFGGWKFSSDQIAHAFMQEPEIQSAFGFRISKQLGDRPHCLNAVDIDATALFDR
ncbi:MAG: hypothetical protein ACI87A_001481 [Planctomycetota bacterium]|jgi:hypothetical protein